MAVTSDQHTKRDGEDWLRLAEGVGQAARRSQDVDRKVMLGPSSGQESASREVDLLEPVDTVQMIVQQQQQQKLSDAANAQAREVGVYHPRPNGRAMCLPASLA